MKKFDSCPVTGTTLHPFITCEDYTVSHNAFSVMSNEDGGILVTNPRPELEDLGRYYESEEYISHTDSAQTLMDRVYQWVRSYSLKKKRNLVEQLTTQRTLLDIGCGTGDFLKELQNNHWSVQGMEPNDAAREKAESKLGITLSQDQSLISFEDGSMDVVTMWHVLEHVPDPVDTVAHLHRILRPGGIAVIAVPNFKSKDAEIYGPHWAAYDVPRHLFHFAQNGMKGLFEGRGFSFKKTEPMIFDAYYVSLLSEKYKSGAARPIHAFINGLRSNLAARRNNEWSSLIYIFQKPSN
ncbi:class I SAM-dependent methyltransferase [Cryomorphaceae bacterium]|nr:class I SAM-dependent methyltransferase [Cryomorphaceae bacterium]